MAWSRLQSNKVLQIRRPKMAQNPCIRAYSGHPAQQPHATIMSKTSTVSKKTAARPASSASQSEHQKDVVNRLRRIEGQVRGVIEMIDAGRSNEDLALQMSAVRKAMDKAFYRLISSHIQEAMGKHGGDGKVKKEIERVTQLLEKFG
jgi:DNA-binding FrmR family transcriptional regulator